MTIEQAVVEKIRTLPFDQQKKVLEFVESLQAESAKAPPKRRSPEGLLAHLGIEISAEEIDEARREMWGNFPRDDI